jgi:hypothetical protein
MSSSNSELPPYSETPACTEKGAPRAAHRVAGSTQTCSIKDFHVDYLKIVRESATSYHICLTVDATPIYRIELVSDSTKIGDIQIFSALDPTLPPVAAARLSANPKSRSEPVATICTSTPHLPESQWWPMGRTSAFSVESYQSSIPIIIVPGMASTPHQFSWRTNSLSEPFFELWWDGPLSFTPATRFMHDQRGAEYVFATVARKAVKSAENLIEIRRGGGVDFELSVILQLFVILHCLNKELV